MLELYFDEYPIEKTQIEKESDAIARIGKAGINANQAYENLSNASKILNGKKDDDNEYIEDIEEDSYITDNGVIPFDTMIEGLSNEDYHSFGGLSSTKFPLMDLSIRAFENRHLFDFGKPVFDLGNLVHDCILLPHLVDDMYIESPTVGLETLQANAIREENPNKMVVGQGDIEKYKTIAKLVHIIVIFINFESTKKEVSFFHKHEETGLIFQIRLREFIL